MSFLFFPLSDRFAAMMLANNPINRIIVVLIIRLNPGLRIQYLLSLMKFEAFVERLCRSLMVHCELDASKLRNSGSAVRRAIASASEAISPSR